MAGWRESTFSSEFRAIDRYCYRVWSLWQGSVAVCCHTNNNHQALDTAVHSTGSQIASSQIACILLPSLLKESTDIILHKIIRAWYPEWNFAFLKWIYLCFASPNGKYIATCWKLLLWFEKISYAISLLDPFPGSLKLGNLV